MRFEWRFDEGACVEEAVARVEAERERRAAVRKCMVVTSGRGTVADQQLLGGVYDREPERRE